MEQAINAYYSITASPEFREIERMRERARHNEASALYHAKQEGKLERDHEIVRNALGMGNDTFRYCKADRAFQAGN